MAKITTPSKPKGEGLFLWIAIAVAALFFGYLIFWPNQSSNQDVVITYQNQLSRFPNTYIYRVGNLSTMHVTINGKRGYFVIDTGAEESILDANMLDSLNIKLMDVSIAPGSRLALTDTIDVSVDSLFTMTKTFYTYDLKNFKRELPKTIQNQLFGILGQDALKRHGLILDFKHDKVYMTEKVF